MSYVRSLRECYVCSEPVPNDEETCRAWEAFRDNWPGGSRMQYRCPKHRTKNPRLATIGDAIAAKKKAS